MEARLLHYSGRALLITPPTAPSPSSAPAAAPGFAGALPAAEHDDGAVPVSFNTNAIVLLAFLICGLVAAVALHVVLQCALRVTRRACYHGAGAGAMRQEPRRAAAAGVGEGGGRARRVGGGGGRNLAAALSTTMPCVAYTGGLELAGSSPSECAICLAEFARGDQVRVLPRCNHGFHPHCIDRWLGARPTCPTCRQVPFADEPVAAPGLAAGTAPVVPVVRGIVITSH